MRKVNASNDLDEDPAPEVVDQTRNCLGQDDQWDNVLATAIGEHRLLLSLVRNAMMLDLSLESHVWCRNGTLRCVSQQMIVHLKVRILKREIHNAYSQQKQQHSYASEYTILDGCVRFAHTNTFTHTQLKFLTFLSHLS